VKAISFNLKDTLTFKKEYKMIVRESSMTALIKRYSDKFAERDQNIGQALQTLNQLKNGRIEG
jgi:glutamate 5-kinase